MTKTESDMVNLEFNAALMQKKAGAVMAECEHIKDICRRIQNEAEAGCYCVVVDINWSRMPKRVDIFDVVAFFETLGFLVRILDHACYRISIKWDQHPKPLCNIDA